MNGFLRSSAVRLRLTLLLFIGAAPSVPALEEIVFEDIWGRRLNEPGMTLVDWEGQIANPAIRIFVRPPVDATFPARAVVTAAEPRLYFDLPSATGGTGPSKTLTFPNANPVPIVVSIFPDRDGAGESHALNVTFTSGNAAARTQTLNVRVVDQDQPQRPADFSLVVDYAHDVIGFFADTARRAVATQNAQDWTYFFGGPPRDPVSIGAERTWIWSPEGFVSPRIVTNTVGYRDFLLYIYGISGPGPVFRSGGEASAAGGYQSVNGVALPLRRSGGVEIEIKGSYNTLGWFVSHGDADWWEATNLASGQHDLASVCHHESGHAMIFNAGHPGFATFRTAGAVNAPAVVAYHGQAPVIDSSEHLAGAVDRLSGRGAFGNDYFGTMPPRRWLITKLDLLVAQAVGYPLRDTSPFTPLAIATADMPHGIIGATYAHAFAARGGIPFYKWSLTAGALPPGLALDSFTGAVTGRPTTLGHYPFTIELADYDARTPPVAVPFSITIAEAATGGRLVNLSILTRLAAGETMTLGTVLGGAGTRGPKPLISRAAGPSLSIFGVADPLPDPKLALVANATGRTIAANDDWNGDGTLAAAFARVGAFSYTSAASKDAGLYEAALAPGSYTVQVSGRADDSGTFLAEIYDATAASAFTTATPRLINLSVLKQIAPWSTLTAGFVIGGGTNRTLLVRAVGPTLGLPPFNLDGVMENPVLEVLNNATGATIHGNDDWGTPAGPGAATPAQLTAAFTATGAFALAGAATQDAVLLVSLAPGQYSARVSGAQGGGGMVIVEVYEVP